MKKHLLLSFFSVVLSTFVAFGQSATCEDAQYVGTGFSEYLEAGTYWFYTTSFDFPFNISFEWDQTRTESFPKDDDRPECIVDFSCKTGIYEDPDLYKVMHYVIDSLQHDWPAQGYLQIDPTMSIFSRSFGDDYRTALFIFGVTKNVNIYIKVILHQPGWLTINSTSVHAICLNVGTQLEIGQTYDFEPGDSTELYMWPIAEWAHTNYQMIWQPENEADELVFVQGDKCELDRNIGYTYHTTTYFLEEYDGVFTWNSNKALAETKEFGQTQEYMRFYPDGPGKLIIKQMPVNINGFAMLDSTVFATIDQENRVITAALPKGTDLAAAVETAIITFEPINQTYSYNDDFTLITIDDELKSTYKLNFTVVPPEANNDATLKEITLDGQPIPNFQPNVFEYTVDWSVVPEVGATTNDPNANVVSIKQPSDYVRYATINVAAEDVYTTNTYIVNLNLPKHTDATLCNIKVGDSYIPDFDPNVLRYEYNVPAAELIPDVVGQKCDRLATVANDPVYNAFLHRNVLPDSTLVICTAENGESLTYTIVFDSFYSTDVSLKDIKVNGTTLAQFIADPTRSIYTNISVASFPPVLEVVPTHPNATVKFEEPTQPPKDKTRGTWQFVVTAEDQYTTQQYTLNFRITNGNAALKAITVNDKPLSSFSATIYDYSINMSELPTSVTAETDDPQANLQTSEETLEDGGKRYTFVVTATDARTICTYTLEFHVAQVGSDATLSAILIDDKPIAGFSPTQYDDYIVSMTEWPTNIVPVTNDPDAKIVSISNIKMGDYNRTYHIVVMAADGLNSADYSFIVQIQTPSSDATLSLISIDDGETEIPGFSPTVYDYYFNDLDQLIDHSLLYFETNDEKASTSVIWSDVNNGEQATIFVTAEDGNTLTYRLHFNLKKQQDPELSHNANLAYLMVGADMITTFMPGDDANLIEVEELDKESVLAVAADSKATVTSEWTDEQTLSVLVTAEDGVTTEKYVFEFELPYVPEPSHDANLLTIIVDVIDVIERPEPDKVYTYTVESLPLELDYIKSDEKATVSEQWLDDNSNVTLVVTAEDGTTKLYYYLAFTIKEEPQLSDDATLQYIEIFGTRYTEFEVNKNNVINLDDMPTEDDVVIKPTDDNATFDVEHVDNTFSVTITAENGENQLTYVFVINITYKSDDNTLYSITLNGNDMEDFNPNTLQYNNISVYELPIVGATANDDKATLSITQPTTGNPSAAIVVTAENGEIRTYTLNFVLVVEPDDDLIPLEVVFSNGFKGFINAAANTIDVYYLSTESQPAAIRSWKPQEGATIQSVELTSANQLTVKARSGEAVYTVNYHPVQYATLPLDQLVTFNGDEEYIKNSYFYTDSRGWRISKDIEESTNRRISRGKDRLYFFLQGCAAIQLSTTTASRSVRISLNGQDITEQQVRYNEQLGKYYTASQGDMTYINGLTTNQPMMLEIESFESFGDAGFNGIKLLSKELPIDELENNLIDNIIFANNTIINPNGLELHLYSVTGQLMTISTANIDMTAYPSAIYIVRYENQIMKIVK